MPGTSPLKLRRLAYSLNHDEQNNWEIEWDKIDDLQMIVGVNTTGKTRLLNLIRGAAHIMAGNAQLPPGKDNFDFTLENGSATYRYKFSKEDTKVTSEILTINDELYLERKLGQPHRIRIEIKEYDGSATQSKWIPFGITDNQLSLVAKRDTIQHPFLEPIIKWAENVDHQSFTAEGSGFHIVLPTNSAFELTTARKTQTLIPIAGFFKYGIDNYDKEFSEFVKEGMTKIGFPINKVDLIPFPQPNGQETLTVSLTEKGRTFPTHYHEMSSGMIRALSSIVRLRLCQLGTKGTLLLDDIGEGLDYKRSVALIKFLLSEAEDSQIQLLMTTNDRFVMNEVPLDYWIILDRTNGTVSVKNSKNERSRFEKFMRLGLSNFDLFKSFTGTPKDD
ncbi:AAA family ATPase [Burkholderia gladioli]|uniref:AAA family ATPase n=1 Tax=Burkholderia gladioli TaxID=28095 RepID=UPI001641DD46|nr:AAA family ATPase [Burkholderia gladioli]